MIMFGYSDENGFPQERVDELFIQYKKEFDEKRYFYNKNDLGRLSEISCRFSMLGFYEHAESLSYEGLMWRYGYGVQQYNLLAFNCFEKAVRLGGRTLLSSMAYYELGLMYQQGEVVKKDLLKARTLFMKAIEKDGNEQARIQLDEINKLILCNYLGPGYTL